MSKTLDTVMHYASEDVAKIKKHWIIFFKRTKKLLIQNILVLVLYYLLKDGLIFFADKINQSQPTIPFEIKTYIFPAVILFLFIKIIVDYVKTIIEYKTVGLSINNIQIKGKSGILSIGIVNVPLEQIKNVQVHTPFLGRILHYGSISVTTSGGIISMTDMINVEKFQDAVVLMQEAQKEGRNIRQAERQEQAIEAHATAQVKALEAQTMAQVQMLSNISQSISHGSEQSDILITEKNRVLLPEEETSN